MHVICITLFGARYTTLPNPARAARALCLSKIKSEHIRGAIRRGLGGKEYALPSSRSAIGARPYPRPSASGVRLSVLGVGTGSLANSGGADQFEAMIEAAWSGGLRHFDTAALYLNGESERRLGAAMQGKPREAYTLSTKAGRFASGSGSRFDYSRDSFMRSVETSLCRLQVDWLDIVMIHDLDPEHHGSGHAARMHEALDGACVALDMLRRRGVVRAIGVGSMNRATAPESAPHRSKAG